MPPERPVRTRPDTAATTPAALRTTDTAANATKATRGEPDATGFYLGGELKKFLTFLGERSRASDLGDVERRTLSGDNPGPIIHVRLTSTLNPEIPSSVRNVVPDGHTLAVDISSEVGEPATDVEAVTSFLNGAVALAGVAPEVAYGAIHVINPPDDILQLFDDPQNGWGRFYEHGRMGHLRDSVPDDYPGDARTNRHYIKFLEPEPTHAE